MSVILVDNAYFGHALRRAPRDGGRGLSPEALAKGGLLRVTSNFLVIAKEYDQR